MLLKTTYKRLTLQKSLLHLYNSSQTVGIGKCEVLIATIY